MDTVLRESEGIIGRPALLPAFESSRVRLAKLESQIETLFTRLRIGVVYGGDKSADGAVIHHTANPRSWKSYEAIAENIADALKRIGFRHVSLMPEDMRLGDRLRRDNIHFAWLNSGGVQGFNPVAHGPALLEMCGVPYVGHDPLTAGTLDNKHAFKRELLYLGHPTAPFMTWHLSRGPFRPKVNSRFIRTFKDHWGAYVVKPVSGRASLHVHVVDDEADLADAVATVFDATGNHVLIESYLPGREFCIAACGPVTAREGRLNQGNEPFTFSAMERILEPGERVAISMDVRPITADRVKMLDPATDMAVVAELHELARVIHLDFHLESIIRLDVRQDVAGRLSILEANPKPDLKRPADGVTSIVCAGLDAHGMTYEDLILTLLANRLDPLLNDRHGSAPHLHSLLEEKG